MTDNITERKFYFNRSRGQITNRRELDKQLSELGGRIWQAIQGDDEITKILFELADVKLSLDKVSAEDARLDSHWAEAIMGDLDPETLERQRPFVPPHEWLKYSLYNFALDWVMDQALMRMKIEQKWPFQENDGFSKS
jgi:hypothetical protein